MSKTTYNIQHKGYVGGWDFDRADVDDMLAQNKGSFPIKKYFECESNDFRC